MRSAFNVAFDVELLTIFKDYAARKKRATGRLIQELVIDQLIDVGELKQKQADEIMERLGRGPGRQVG